MAGFSIVGNIQVQAPNLNAVATQIRSALSGISAPINVNLNAGSITSLTRATGVVNTLTASLNNLTTAATSSAKAIALLGQATQGLQTITGSLNNANQAAQGLTKSLKPVGDAAEAAGRRFLGFSVVTGALIGFINALKSGIGEAISFEKELVKFTQVGIATSSEIKGISDEVTRLSTSYGVASKEILQSATTLKQAGFSISQVKDVLETLAQTSLAPSFDNLAKTTEGLIAVMSQFKLTTNEARDALGAINAVSNSYAVESRDLIEAVKRAGGAFSTAGGNVQEFIALTTSVRATTREAAESIATGLRTIFSRFQRSGTVDALHELGINLRYTREEAEALGTINLEQQFVGVYEAVRRVSEGLSQIRQTDPRYSRVIDELGGARNYQRILPLLQQVTLSQEALSVAQGGSVSIALAADQAQTTYANSLAKTREQFLALTRGIISSPAFSSLISQLTSLANAFLTVVNIAQPLIPLLTSLAGIKLAQSAFSFLGGVAPGLKNATSGIRTVLGFSRGGPVPGSGHGDTVPAALEPGEFVLRKEASQLIGYDRLNKANRMASGGLAQTRRQDTFLSSFGGGPSSRAAGAFGIPGRTQLYNPAEKGRSLVAIGDHTSFFDFLEGVDIPSSGYNFGKKSSGPINAPRISMGKRGFEVESIDDYEQLLNLKDKYDSFKVISARTSHARSIASTFAGSILSSGEARPHLSDVLENVFSKNEDAHRVGRVVAQFTQSKEGNELLGLLPQNASFLGAGLQAIALRSGDEAIRLSQYGVSEDTFVGKRPKIAGVNPSTGFLKSGNLAAESSKILQVLHSSGLSAVVDKKRKLIGGAQWEKQESLRHILLQQGYISTDDHPGNIGLDKAGNPLLIDLGGLHQMKPGETEASYRRGYLRAAGGYIPHPRMGFAGGGLFQPTKDDLLESLNFIQGNTGYNFYKSNLINKLGFTNKQMNFGDVQTDSYRGYFDPKELLIGINPNTINSKNSLTETLAHEIGHSVDYNARTRRYASNDLWTPNGKIAAAMLNSRSRFDKITPENSYRRYERPEGFADFFAKYATSDKPNAPYFRQFQSILESRGVPRLKGFANGGAVDTVPAMLTPGEYVFNREAVSRIGVGELNRWNAGGNVKGYAEGGPVPGAALTLANRELIPRAEPFINYRGLFDAMRASVLNVRVVGITSNTPASRQLTESPSLIPTPPGPRLLTYRSPSDYYAGSPVSFPGPTQTTGGRIPITGFGAPFQRGSSPVGNYGNPLTSLERFQDFTRNTLGAQPSTFYNSGLGRSITPGPVSSGLDRIVAAIGRQNNYVGLGDPNQYASAAGPVAPTRFQRARSFVADTFSGFGSYFTDPRVDDKGQPLPSRLKSIGPFAGFALAGAAGYLGQQVRPGDASEYAGGRQDEFKNNRGLAGGLEGGGIGLGVAAGLGFSGLGLVVGALAGGIINYNSEIKQAAEELRKVKIDKALTNLSEVFERLVHNQNVSLTETNAAIADIQTLRTEAVSKAVEQSTPGFLDNLRGRSGLQNFQQNLQQNQRQNLGPLATNFYQALNRQVEQFGQNLAQQPGFAALRGDDLRQRVTGQSEAFLGGNNGLNREAFESIVSLRSQTDPNARANVTQQFERALVNSAQRASLRARGQEAGANAEQSALTFGRLAQTVEVSINAIEHFQQRISALDTLFEGQITAIQAISRQDVFKNFGSGEVGGALEPFKGLFGGRADNLLNQASAYDQFKQVLPDLISQVVRGGDLGKESAETQLRTAAESRFGRGFLEQNGLSGLLGRAGANISDENFLTPERRLLLRSDPNKFAQEASGPAGEIIENATQQFNQSLEQLGQRITAAFSRLEQRLGKIIDAEDKRAQTALTGERTLSQLNANVRLRPSEGPLSVERENRLFTGQNVRLAINSGLAPGLANDPAAIAAQLTATQAGLPAALERRNATAAGSPEFAAADQAVSYLQGASSRLTKALENLANASERTAAAQRRIGEISQDRDARLNFGTRFLASDVNERNRTIDNLRLVQVAGQRGGLNGFAPSQESRIVNTLSELGQSVITIGGQERVASEVLREFVQARVPGVRLAPGRAEEEQRLIAEIGQAFTTAREANDALINNLRSLQEQSYSLLRQTIGTENNRFLTELSTRLLQAEQRSAQAALQANAVRAGGLQAQTRGLDTLRGFGVDTSNQDTLSYLTGGEGIRALETYAQNIAVVTQGYGNLSNTALSGVAPGRPFNVTNVTDSAVLARQTVNANRDAISGLGVDADTLINPLTNAIRTRITDLIGRSNFSPETGQQAVVEELREALRESLSQRGAAAQRTANEAARGFRARGGPEGLLTEATTAPGLQGLRETLAGLQGINLRDYQRLLESVNDETRQLTTNLNNINNLLVRNLPVASRPAVAAATNVANALSGLPFGLGFPTPPRPPVNFEQEANNLLRPRASIPLYTGNHFPADAARGAASLVGNALINPLLGISAPFGGHVGGQVNSGGAASGDQRFAFNNAEITANRPQGATEALSSMLQLGVPFNPFFGIGGGNGPISGVTNPGGVPPNVPQANPLAIQTYSQPSSGSGANGFQSFIDEFWGSNNLEQPANQLSTSFNEFTNALRPFVTALERFPSNLTGSFQHRVDVNVNGGEVFGTLEPLTRQLVVGEVRRQLTRYIEENMPGAGLPQE